VAADDTGDDRSGVQADSDRQLEPERLTQASKVGLHVEGHLGHRLGMVGAGLGQAGNDHVRVADRLDLLDAVALGQVIEGGEDLVQDGDHPVRLGSFDERGEVDDVGEQDGDLAVGPGDPAFLPLEAIGDRLGEDVQEQPLGALKGGVPGANGVLQEEIGGHGNPADIQNEEGRPDRDRDRRSIARDDRLEEARDHRQRDNRQEPRDRPRAL